MASMPITKIIIKITDPQLLLPGNVWQLFDLIIREMEQLEKRDGDAFPIVDAAGRKQFRVQVMKALEARRDPMEVFNQWVTVLVPQFVPMVPPARAVMQEQADKVAAGVEKDVKLEEKAADIRLKQRANLAKARAAKKHPPKKKWVEKGVLDGPTEEEKLKKALEGLEE